MVLDEAYKYACAVSGPLNQIGDREACRLETAGSLRRLGSRRRTTPFVEQGWKLACCLAGLRGPGCTKDSAAGYGRADHGSEPVLHDVPVAHAGAAEVIEQFGSPSSRSCSASACSAAAWGGTMCLTEPHAGTRRRRLASTTATRNADGSYAIRGTKIFISGGDHDLAENIIHLVLARVDGAPAGHQGPVALHRPEASASNDGRRSGESNDVHGRVHRAQDGHQRLGDLRARTSARTASCIGELVGDEREASACRRCSR